MRSQSLRHEAEFAHLASVIRGAQEQGDGRLVFVPSPGNWGDALINEGSRQFFRFFGFDVEELRREALLARLEGSAAWRNRTIVVGGGGGWCENFSTTPEFVSAIRQHVGRVVMLPTTYELPLLTGPGAPVHYVARHMERSADAEFCHDMAFFIDFDVDVDVDNRLWRLFAMRQDIERHPEAFTPDRNVDLSALGNAYSSTHQFFELVARFDELFTDRLHVAIAASMLGRRTYLLAGNYRKSVAVFESSIEPNYPNTSVTTWNALSERLGR